MASKITDIEVSLRGNPQINTKLVKSEELNKCSLCDMKFVKAEGLKLHQDIHSMATSFMCSSCDKTFPSTDALASQKVIHTVREPFGCSKCGKSFKEADLKLHEAIHMASKPFICLKCNKSFLRTFAFKTHKKICSLREAFSYFMPNNKGSKADYLKQIQSLQKPCSCADCEKKSTRKCDLELHEEIHDKIHAAGVQQQYNYTRCNKKLTYSNSLKLHEEIHTGGELFKCSECNMKFSKEDSVEFHQEIHSISKNQVRSNSGKRHTAAPVMPCSHLWFR